MKTKRLTGIILTGVVLVGLFYAKTALAPKSNQKTEPTKTNAAEAPATKSLTVPYSVQAPFADWKTHQESCEEAAAAMYHDFLQGKKEDLTANEADKRFREMKQWQVINYGKEPDLSIDALGKFTQAYYNDDYRVINLTKESIKSEITAGRPVIVPVMTQSLNNPHYSRGNVYHVLLIKGFNKTEVITNDPGVKQGKDWHYSWEVLFSAVDAQTSKINQGRVGLILFR